MCTENCKDHHYETSSHVTIILKRTDAWYSKYMGEEVTEPNTDPILMTRGIDFLGIEDATDASSTSGSSSENSCWCGSPL